MDFNNYKQRLLELNTPQVSDTGEHVNIMDSSIRSYGSRNKLVGRAFTVKSRGNYHAIIDALDQANKDDVLIINNEISSQAIVGELFATAAKRKELAGIIIDGYCRDIEGIRASGIPVFAKGITPQIADNTDQWELQIPVICGGVSVRPNDVIFADQNGVVVIDPQNLATVLQNAESISEREDDIKKQIISGIPLSSLVK